MQDTANYGLRDEIKAYWSSRAATFDLQPGHEIFSEAERKAWHELILRSLGRGEGRTALDLASGTGVISHLMDDLGYAVTGLDWAEPMLDRSKSKAKERGRRIRFVLGDAENTLEPDASFDVVVTRHLVWTLVDPIAAFAEWFRVLKPGGSLLVIDGDFVTPTWVGRLQAMLNFVRQRLGFAVVAPAAEDPKMRTHRDILARVHFSAGARAPEVVRMLEQAGFADIVVDHDLKAIHRAQARHMQFFKGLERGAQHRYAICACKPR
jgi:ubiquinone/menaquinone biosynthesis C-methylase UbiE